MKTYGGFLGLEPVALSPRLSEYHDSVALSTGRSCLRLIVTALRPRRVYVPFYMCDAALSSLQDAHADLVMYGINHELVPDERPAPASDALFIFVNYFGVLGPTASALAARLGNRIVVDNAHAFFHRCPTGSWWFNSARKFFGVPDGAYLQGPVELPAERLSAAEAGLDHLVLRASGDLTQAYAAFQHYERGLDSEVRAASATTLNLLRCVDYGAVAARRRANYLVLERLLAERNRLHVKLSRDDVPVYYPLLPSKAIRHELIRRGVLVPCLWSEVIGRAGGSFLWERELAALLCPLPVDQRYDSQAMEEIASRALEALDS